MGGAIFTPLTLTMLSAVTPPGRRGTVLGAWGGIGGLGAALGPRRRLDLTGVALGSAGLSGVVWAVIRAGAAGWTSAETSLALGGGVALLVLFVCWEMRTPAPMLPMRFFRSRVFTAGALACLAMYAAVFGALFLITQLLQVGMGATPLQAGLRTLPMAVMPLLLAPAGGVITDRIGFRPLMICGLALESVALGWLAAVVTPDVPYGLLVAPLALAGAGVAVFFAPLTTAMLSAVAPEEQGQASGAATAIRELAVVLGVAGLGLLLDLDTHARHGQLIVVEADGRIRGFGAFYPDASVQGLGWPPGWASGRALAVHPDARGHGVARALLAASERLARQAGAPVFAFHTASFMTDAIALYERLGFRRVPEFDFDMAARYGGTGAAPITALAYLHQLAPTRAARA